MIVIAPLSPEAKKHGHEEWQLAQDGDCVQERVDSLLFHESLELCASLRRLQDITPLPSIRHLRLEATNFVVVVVKKGHVLLSPHHQGKDGQPHGNCGCKKES